jgi:hypothetical protein
MARLVYQRNAMNQRELQKKSSMMMALNDE